LCILSDCYEYKSFSYYRLMAATVEVENQEDHGLVCPVVTAWS